MGTDTTWRYGDTIDSLRAAAFRLEEASDDLDIARLFAGEPTEMERDDMYNWILRIKILLDGLDVG